MGACTSQDSSGQSISTTAAEAAAKSRGSNTTACQVFDTAELKGKSFHQTAHEGFVRAQKELGVTTKLLESKSEADYAPDIASFVEQGGDLIIPGGFLLADATQTSAEAHPEQKYSIVDFDFVDNKPDPPNDIMNGFLAGVQQYLKEPGKSVQVLGWNGTEGMFAGDF